MVAGCQEGKFAAILHWFRACSQLEGRMLFQKSALAVPGT